MRIPKECRRKNEKAAAPRRAGWILTIEIEKPRYHATEDSRWDDRVTLTFRGAATAHDPEHEKAIQREL